MRRLLLALSVLPLLAACGGEEGGSVGAVTSAPEVASSVGGGVSSETEAPAPTAAPEPAPTTEAPSRTDEPTGDAAPEPATDRAGRAVEVLDMVGYPGSCDDVARVEGQLVIAGCAGEEMGAVWVVVPPTPSDVDELAVEVMNDLFASACVGDDYVVAAFATAGAELVAGSGLDCSWP